MKNIFENAYFGKAYKTRSGQKAIYLFSSGCGAYCITEEFKNTVRYFHLDGIPYDFESSKYRGEDIVSEWQEPIVCECKWKDYYDYRIMMPLGEAHVRVSFFRNETIISDLFVDEKYRNKGYATILLNKVDELLNGKQATIYPLEHWQKLWYEKRGYIIGKNTEEKTQ